MEKNTEGDFCLEGKRPGLWGGRVMLTLIRSTSTPTTLLMNWVIGPTKEAFSVHLLLQRVSSSCSPLKTLALHLSAHLTSDFQVLTTCASPACPSLCSPKIRIWFPEVVAHPFPLLHQLYFLGIPVWVWTWPGCFKWRGGAVSTVSSILSRGGLTEPQSGPSCISVSLPTCYKSQSPMGFTSMT